jgi:hypothetical protein
MADEAIARAKELDEHYRRTGRLIGPLVGPPLDVPPIEIDRLMIWLIAWRSDQCQGAYLHEKPNMQHGICSLVSRTLLPWSKT